MNTPERCLKCGDSIQHEFTSTLFKFSCGSVLDLNGALFSEESAQCIENQRDQLTAKLAALESANAECAKKMKRFRSRWLAAHKRIMEMENEAERASERVKRMEFVGDAMAALIQELGDDPFITDKWTKAKGNP